MFHFGCILFSNFDSKFAINFAHQISLFCRLFTNLLFSVPPKIDPNVESIWVQEGWNWNLTCDVRSNSVVDITWKKNGVDIKTSSRARTIQNGRKLMLFDMQVRRAEAGLHALNTACFDLWYKRQIYSSECRLIKIMLLHLIFFNYVHLEESVSPIILSRKVFLKPPKEACTNKV